MKEFQRFEMQIGAENIKILEKANVLLVGLGGVGGSVAETLARSGIGSITLIDKDEIDITNINRQIIALHSTINMPKVDVCANRLRDINPNIKIETIKTAFCESCSLDFKKYDYIIDAVDDVNAKIAIIKRAKENSIPVISCMGTGNKFNPLTLRVCDIEKSSVCPLARIIRLKLRKLGISGVKCLFSTEKPLNINGNTISSNALVPNTAGILIAREVIFDLIKKE